MTIHLINYSDNSDLYDVTEIDLRSQGRKDETVRVDLAGSFTEQISMILSLDLRDGDVVAIAGTVLRPMTWTFLDMAIESRINLMPGRTVDHRTIDIPKGKFFSRRPQDENGHPGVPYVMLIGDAVGAKESWNLLSSLDANQVWAVYKPETFDLLHWLSAAAALHASWQTPDWFPVTDLSVRDLEISTVMYATNHWSDWIAFYPSNGAFKLENHAQLYPVWLDHSTKPLDYWNVKE